jgi:hypothetical protein
MKFSGKISIIIQKLFHQQSNSVLSLVVVVLVKKKNNYCGSQLVNTSD